MFCSKCGKTIDDNAAFCSFCGNVINGAAPSAPVEAAPQQPAPQQPAPQYSVPQQPAPQYSAPQQQAPQYGAPQQQAPQYGAPQQQAPQYGAQQGQYGYAPAPTLSPAAINMINMIIKGILAVLAVLILIGAIGALASYGALKSGNLSSYLKGAQALLNFIGLARVPAIIAFSFTLVDVVFAALTKQKSKLTYINVGIGVILFTFNFVMYGNMNGENGSEGGFIVACVFLLVGSVALLASALLTLFKKENLLFRPRPQYPPMPPTPPAPPSYPPYQQ